jgi:hypothetical protein
MEKDKACVSNAKEVQFVYTASSGIGAKNVVAKHGVVTVSKKAGV